MTRLTDMRARFTPLVQSFVPSDIIATGLLFDCPCERCGAASKRQRLWVAFMPPIDPEHRMDDTGYQGTPPVWARTGDTLETITLAPSIDFSKSGHWHGMIINGEMVTT